MPGHYGDKKKKRAPSARPTKSKGPVMKGVKDAASMGQVGKGAKAMAMKTMALLKKKKKK
jgi:hypothetical protein